jgi:hypothetical protein
MEKGQVEIHPITTLYSSREGDGGSGSTLIFARLELHPPLQRRARVEVCVAAGIEPLPLPLMLEWKVAVESIFNSLF